MDNLVLALLFAKVPQPGDTKVSWKSEWQEIQLV